MTALQLQKKSRPIFNEKNLRTSELYKVTQARIWKYRSFLRKRSRKDTHPLLCHVGLSRHESPIKSGGLVPEESIISKGRYAVYFSLVSPLDPIPDPKCKHLLHMKNHHERLFVIDLEAAQNSLEFY